MTTIKYTELHDFSKVAVGDIVMVRYGAGTYAQVRPVKVSRITSTQLVCNDKYGNEERYRIHGGKQVGAEGGRFGWVHTNYAIGIEISEASVA
jgi:hypothetical protein